MLPDFGRIPAISCRLKFSLPIQVLYYIRKICRASRLSTNGLPNIWVKTMCWPLTDVCSHWFKPVVWSSSVEKAVSALQPISIRLRAFTKTVRNCLWVRFLNTRCNTPAKARRARLNVCWPRWRSKVRKPCCFLLLMKLPGFSISAATMWTIIR